MSSIARLPRDPALLPSSYQVNSSWGSLAPTSNPAGYSALPTNIGHRVTPYALTPPLLGPADSELGHVTGMLPNLTTLTLTSIMGITGCDLGLFRTFRNIKHLKLIHHGVRDTTLSILAEPHSSPPFTTLTLAPIGNHLDTTRLFLFLRSRAASGHPIAKVRLSHGYRASLNAGKVAALLQMVDIEEFEVDEEVELPLSEGTRNLEWWE
ncbi:hypothetical protein JAAARDRAFT_51416 [Jaapia argillacea MUCL 33604]|uniref:F-box domain-containing protein n=1 Tax=Jaapia argillacea MUCL 33604 TaxID=933084 RepID=A0A067PI36_9AGAM|nr:hypothetical protein JAAARDRAFT_51416 [Jaapia argillacea MUCL 33604]